MCMCICACVPCVRYVSHIHIRICKEHIEVSISLIKKGFKSFALSALVQHWQCNSNLQLSNHGH